MSSSIFLQYCLLIFALYFFFQHTSYSIRVMPTRNLSMSSPAQEHKYQETQYKMQVADEEMGSTDAKEDSMTLEYTSNSYSPHDLVYHIDYHGVTTHPIPKHPTP